MTINFLGQGFEAESPNSTGNYLIRNFSSDRFNRFFGMSAFASVAGVRVLSEHILRAKANFESLSLVVGVDQEGTSREALNELLGKGRARLGMLEGDMNEGELEIGQVAGLIRDLPSVATLVDRLRKEYNAAISNMPKTM